MIVKFGPLSKSDCCTAMSGLADRFITHFLLGLLVVSVLLFETSAVEVVVVLIVVVVVVVDCLLMLLLKFVRTILPVSLFLDGGYLLLVCWL